MVRKPSSHAHAASVRANTPRLASPPLSPERAPTTRPSGARLGRAAGRRGRGPSVGPDDDGTAAGRGRARSGSCDRRRARTAAPGRRRSAPGGTRRTASPRSARRRRRRCPGMLDSAVSMTASENARPTLRSSGSFTEIRHSAVRLLVRGRVGACRCGRQRVDDRREVVRAVRAGRPERVGDDLRLRLDVEAGERDRRCRCGTRRARSSPP